MLSIRGSLPLALLLAACAPSPTGPQAPSPSPSQRLTSTPAAATPSGLIAHQAFTLESKALGEARRINVYTPPGHGDASGATYPLLYMPDGGVEEDFPHVIATVDAAIRAGEMQPLVVVGVENTQRRRDMTGPTTVESDKAIAPRVGGSAAFRAFFRDELMPAMRTRVRGGGRTAIIGESLAGLFVVETFFLAPDTFDVYIALSPSLWWNDRSLVRGARAWRDANPRSNKTFYLTVAGDDDRDDAIASLGAFLRSDAPEGLTWFYEPRPSERHDTIYRASEGPVLRKLFPPIARLGPGSGKALGG